MLHADDHRLDSKSSCSELVDWILRDEVSDWPAYKTLSGLGIAGFSQEAPPSHGALRVFGFFYTKEPFVPPEAISHHAPVRLSL